MKDTHYHIGQVLAANFAAIGITFTNVEDTLKIISLILAIAYSARRLYMDWNNKRNNDK